VSATSTATVPLPRRLASLVRIEHTVFALPFAYVGTFLAAGDWPGLAEILWITVAMIGARTASLAFVLSTTTDRPAAKLADNRRCCRGSGFRALRMRSLLT